MEPVAFLFPVPGETREQPVLVAMAAGRPSWGDSAAQGYVAVKGTELGWAGGGRVRTASSPFVLSGGAGPSRFPSHVLAGTAAPELGRWAGGSLEEARGRVWGGARDSDPHGES